MAMKASLILVLVAATTCHSKPFRFGFGRSISFGGGLGGNSGIFGGGGLGKEGLDAGAGVYANRGLGGGLRSHGHFYLTDDNGQGIGVVKNINAEGSMGMRAVASIGGKAGKGDGLSASADVNGGVSIVPTLDGKVQGEVRWATEDELAKLSQMRYGSPSDFGFMNQYMPYA